MRVSIVFMLTAHLSIMCRLLLILAVSVTVSIMLDFVHCVFICSARFSNMVSLLVFSTHLGAHTITSVLLYISLFGDALLLVSLQNITLPVSLHFEQ